MKFRMYKLALIAVLLVGLGLSGCSRGEKTVPKVVDEPATTHDHDEKTAHDQGEQPERTSHTDMGGTMKAALTADQLYECTMCAGVVSADIDTLCPICNMKLTPMSSDKTSSLRLSHPKGCPMDKIVFEGGSETNNCPVCKMELKIIS